MARRYQRPLSAADRAELFAEWMQANSEAVAAIEEHALALADAGHKRVSAKYLAEWARYELAMALVPVPYVDMAGNAHAYGINNNDTAALARWLKSRHPWLPIELRRSALDEVVAGVAA